jgi:hypothetical protein
MGKQEEKIIFNSELYTYALRNFLLTPHNFYKQHVYIRRTIKGIEKCNNNTRTGDKKPKLYRHQYAKHML